MKSPSEEAGLTITGDIAGILNQGEFEWGIVSATGMVFKDETPESDWKRITENLCILYEHTGKKNAQTAMMLGDALRWGEEKFGERYADVIDATRDYMRAIGIKTLQNWQWIAGKIAPHRRHANLSLAHHEAVAKLPADEQDKFLALAEGEAMTVKELRSKIREEHPSKPRKSKSVTKTDSPQSALQKMVDVSNWLSEHFDEVDNKWKEPLGKAYKAYRRCFMGSGHGNKA